MTFYQYPFIRHLFMRTILEMTSKFSKHPRLCHLSQLPTISTLHYHTNIKFYHPLVTNHHDCHYNLVGLPLLWLLPVSAPTTIICIAGNLTFLITIIIFCTPWLLPQLSIILLSIMTNFQFYYNSSSSSPPPMPTLSCHQPILLFWTIYTYVQPHACMYHLI